MSDKYWIKLTLEEMSDSQWESLCDGCGLCCLVKIEDEDSGEVLNTSVSCKLLDTDSCRCKDYGNRFREAPMCTKLTRENLPTMTWLPKTCAYVLLADRKPLPEWHYLISGDREAVHKAGVSAKRFALSEDYIHPEQLEQFVIELEK